MTWNHKTRVVALGIALQPTPGVFVQPAQADLIASAPPTNSNDVIETEDPTATGTVWESSPIYLGMTSTVGAMVPMRGPGGVAVPAANAWVPGRILQSAGFVELRNSTAITAALGVGSTVDEFVLDATASSVDGAYVGMPIQHADIGSGAIKGSSIIVAYDGATKTARIGETLPAAPGAGDFTIPMNLTYLLGTLTTLPPLLSVSVWRDRVRYDYRDCRPTSLIIDMPVSNEQNQGFPSIEFTLKGLPVTQTDEASPTVPEEVIRVSIPPYRAGKFALDGVRLGHQSNRFTISTEVAGASNSNVDPGQDEYEIMSGSRQVELDLNQMNVSDFPLATLTENRTPIRQMSMWGQGPGNRFGFTNPEIVLNPLSPGDRNGFVNLTGNAGVLGVDKSAALSIFW